MPLARFESLGRIHWSAVELELSICSRSRWKIQKPLYPPVASRIFSSMRSLMHLLETSVTHRITLISFWYEEPPLKSSARLQSTFMIRKPILLPFSCVTTSQASSRTTVLTLIPKNEACRVALLRYPSSYRPQTFRSPFCSEEPSGDQST